MEHLSKPANKFFVHAPSCWNKFADLFYKVFPTRLIQSCNNTVVTLRCLLYDNLVTKKGRFKRWIWRYPPDSDFSTAIRKAWKAMTPGILNLQEIKSDFNLKMLKFCMFFTSSWTCVESLKNYYPMDRAIYLSYNRALGLVVRNVNSAIHQVVIFSNFLNMFSITGKTHIKVWYPWCQVEKITLRRIALFIFRTPTPDFGFLF